jgi:hypothetical protein
MFELTPDQRQDLQGAGETRVIDPETKQEYVVLRADVYKSMKADSLSEYNTKKLIFLAILLPIVLLAPLIWTTLSKR